MKHFALLEELRVLLLVQQLSSNNPQPYLYPLSFSKYGLIYLENGQTVLPCDELDKLYAIKDLGVTKYVGEREKERIELSNYLEYRGMQTVELNQFKHGDLSSPRVY